MSLYQSWGGLLGPSPKTKELYVCPALDISFKITRATVNLLCHSFWMKIRYCEYLIPTNSAGAGLLPIIAHPFTAKLFKAHPKQSLPLSHLVRTAWFFFCSSSHSCMYTLQGKAVTPTIYQLFDSRWCLEHEDTFQNMLFRKFHFLYLPSEDNGILSSCMLMSMLSNNMYFIYTWNLLVSSMKKNQ